MSAHPGRDVAAFDYDPSLPSRPCLQACNRGASLPTHAKAAGARGWSCSSLEKLSDIVMVSCEIEHVAWMHLAAASSADSPAFPPSGNGPMIATSCVKAEGSGSPRAHLTTSAGNLLYRRTGRIVFATCNDMSLVAHPENNDGCSPPPK